MCLTLYANFRGLSTSPYSKASGEKIGSDTSILSCLISYLRVSLIITLDMGHYYHGTIGLTPNKGSRKVLGPPCLRCRERQSRCYSWTRFGRLLVRIYMSSLCSIRAFESVLAFEVLVWLSSYDLQSWLGSSAFDKQPATTPRNCRNTP